MKNLLPLSFLSLFVLLANEHVSAEVVGVPTGVVVEASNDETLIGSRSSLTLTASGQLAIAYVGANFDNSGSSLRLWIDDGSGSGTANDRVASGSEIRLIISNNGGFASPSILLTQNGNLAISFQNGSTLALWVDDGAGGGIANDGRNNGDELRTIDDPGYSAGAYSSLTEDASGNLAISYSTIPSGGPVTSEDLSVWVDDGAGGGTAGDLIANGTEIRIIDSDGRPGIYTSITRDRNNNLAVSYYDDANDVVKLWVDDGAGGGTAGDAVSNGTEIRTIDSVSLQSTDTSIVKDANGNLAVVYIDSEVNGGQTEAIVKIWIDDGRGGATAADAIVNGSEIRTIGSAGASNGQTTAITLDSSNNLAVSYAVLGGGDLTAAGLRLWVDNGAGNGIAGDGVPNGSEIETLDSNVSGNGLSIGKESNGNLVVSYNSVAGNTGVLKATIGTSICSEWNGFFSDRMWNILEHVNLTDSFKFIDTTIFDIEGNAQDSLSSGVLGGAQTDILVQDFDARIESSYGRVCSVTNGNAGDLDGRMVFYLPKVGAEDGSDFDFAFAIPFSNGVSGSQFVPFNTFQPSLDLVDNANLVTNWIQLTNLENASHSGTLYYYAQDGSILATENVSLAAGTRRDFSAHQFGANLVGMIEWRPADSGAMFKMSNVRYFYDNPGTAETFDAAFQLDGAKGSEQLLSVPIDTREGSSIIEISNTTNATRNFGLKIYSADGTLLLSNAFELPAYGTLHYITDSILQNALGSATVDGAAGGSMLVTAMQYGRTQSAGIEFLYGIRAKEASGTTLSGSYNTFLNQECELLVANSSSSQQTLTLGLTRSDGTEVLSGQTLPVPGNGSLSYNLCAEEQTNNYGVVSLQTSSANSIVAQVIRQGQNRQYRFPTPVK